MVSTIEFVKYPVAVRVEVSTIPILVRLSPDLMLAPEGMSVPPVIAAAGVHLVSEGGGTYYEFANLAERIVRYFVRVPPFSGAHYLQLVHVTGTLSPKVIVSADGTNPTHVASHPTLAFSDDFGGSTFDRALWLLAGTPGSLVNIGVANSRLSFTNPLQANVTTQLTSDRIAGRALSEVRAVVESARVAHSGYLLEFNYTSETDPLPTAPSMVRIGFSVTPSTGVVKAVADPTSTVIFNACHAGVWGTDDPILLPAGGVTTTQHTYSVAFDGHRVQLLIDGTAVATRLVRIPHNDCAILEITLRGSTGAIVPVASTTLQLDRIDVVTDTAVAVTATSPLAIDMTGAVIPPPVGMALEVTQLQVLAHAAQIDTTTLAILYAILHGGTAPAGHLLLNFSFADVPASPKLIGTVPAGAVVHVVALIILSAFDQPVSLEVGRLAAPAELMLGTDNNPAMVDTYHTHPDHLYAINTDVYLTLIAGGPLPTAGTGQVIVYLD